MIGIFALVYLLGALMYLVGALYLFLDRCEHRRRWWQLHPAIPYAAIWFCLCVPAYLATFPRCQACDS